ncbi:MAG: ABC transporter ATP-binding protein [Lachnospiraceae bacterium]|nr:ABC transporter ATP-binding protein [Candidatus Colinaster equi]
MSRKVLKQLSAILDKGQKIQIAGLLVMILIAGVLEMLSASMVVPIVEAVLDEETFGQKWYTVIIMNVLHETDMKRIIYIMLFAVMGAFIFKNAFIIWQTYMQARFANRNRARCTTNLLWQYLHRPYEYYLYAETSDIIRTIYGDMDNIFNMLLVCMNLVAEVVVSACLGLFLLILDWKMTVLVVGLLGLLTLMEIKIIKPHLNKSGEGSRITQAGMYKWILQSAAGIKDVKTLHKEYYFTKQYSESAEGYADHQVVNNVLSNLPRLLIECVAIVGILAYVLIRIATGSSMSTMLPTISGFAIAAMRLLPSVNRMNTYIANIAYYEPALQYIYDNVNTKGLSEENALIIHRDDDAKCVHTITMEDKIELDNITFAYPNTDKNIFTEANMEIPVGKSVGVVGPSGSGKTTIVDILLGLLKTQGGAITCDGVDINDDYTGWLSHIGYIPQNIYMLDDTVRKNIAFGVPDEDIDDERIWKVLEDAQMKEFVEELPDKLDAAIGERGIRISGGQRQRLGIARALYHNPELLIFDEATSALDNDTETAIMEAIDRLHGEKTMVIIAHRLRTIENCDMIYEVKDEKINRQR